jgi:hypothetical protein
VTVIKISCVYCEETKLSAPVEALLDDHGLIIEHDCHARHTAPTVTGPKFRVQVVTEKDKENG